MGYLLSNICTKNYWNRTTVKIIIGGWIMHFFVTQGRSHGCSGSYHWKHKYRI